MKWIALTFLAIVAAAWIVLSVMTHREALGQDNKARVIFGVVVLASPTSLLGNAVFGPMLDSVCHFQSGVLNYRRRTGALNVNGETMITSETEFICSFIEEAE